MNLYRDPKLLVNRPRTCYKYAVHGIRVKELDTLPIERKRCIVIDLEGFGDVFWRASHFEIPWRIVLISPMSYLGMKFVVFILNLSENVSPGYKY